MEATNLSISLPSNNECNNCTYCVSKMTHPIKQNKASFYHNLLKAIKSGERAGVTSFLITGKTDPFDSPRELCDVLSILDNNELPVEIQTNIKSYKSITDFAIENPTYLGKFNVLAISLDKFTNVEIGKIKTIIDLLPPYVIIRLTFVVFDNTFHEYETMCFKGNHKAILDSESKVWFNNLINFLPDRVRQITFRNPTTPEYATKTPDSIRAQEYIEAHNKRKAYDIIQTALGVITGGSLVRDLPFGARVVNYKGVAFTNFGYCVQDKNNGKDIRTLVYQADGHLYDSWNNPASIIF